jgi:hypothetical protein
MFSDSENIFLKKLQSDKDALKEQDKHLDLLTAKYKGQILDKCVLRF